MEKRDLYDGNWQLTGEYIFKNDRIPSDRYIAVVIIIIENKEHKLLTQLTSKVKGNIWAFTGGHPKSGETPKEGIITEVYEELGLDISKEKIKLINTHKIDEKRLLVSMFYLKKDVDIASLILQDDEVSSVSYLSIDEINKLYHDNMFRKTSYQCLKAYLKKIKDW